MANGRHPYSDTVGNAFHLLKQIMTEPPPTLEQDERFSPLLVDFVNKSLTVSVMVFGGKFSDTFLSERTRK